MDALAEWKDFHVAMAGAAAALAGLVIVAASVNIERIVKAATLTSRLGAAIAVLVLAISVAGVGLIPGMEPVVFGWLVIAGTAVAAVFQVEASRRIYADPSPADRLRPLKVLAGALPLLAYLVGGVLVVVGMDAGLYVVAAGCLIAIASALLVSWVVLVEVLR